MRILTAAAALALLAPAAGAQHRAGHAHEGHQHSEACRHQAPTYGSQTYGMPSADAPRGHHAQHGTAPTYGQSSAREFYRSERIVTRYHGGTHQGNAHSRTQARQHISRTAPPQWIRDEARAFRAHPAPRTARRAHRNGASYADGSQFSGALHGGLPHGQGSLTYADGSSYTGGFSRGMPHGAGTYRSPMGDVLTGTFQNGVMTSGQARYASGHSYSGPFLSGQPHGEGTMTYADGGSYQGAFQSGRPDGWGMYRDARGQAFQGNWNRGEWDDAPVFTDREAWSGSGTAPARRPAPRRYESRPWR